MTNQSVHIPELLAPAGDWAALRAAVAGGADAVYFGLREFNARRRAANFRQDELPQVVDHLHARNVRAYVTFNTLIFPSELPRVVEHLAALAPVGVDAVIVQDLALVPLLRRLAPTLPVHASTQMTQTEPEGIEFLRELGVERVIVARELSIAELRDLAGHTTMPLEVFVHGALCVSYSGQCLASAALFGRSANRGLCAQACRLPYDLLIDGRLAPPSPRRYPLSPQDLCGLEYVAALSEIGVAALKIEGRLKSPGYVAAATRTYRAALDALRDGLVASVDQNARTALAQTFSRGLCSGFLRGVDHRGLVDGRSSKNRGICVGRVTGRTRRGLIVEPDAEPNGMLPGSDSTRMLKPGDGLVFDEGLPEDQERGGRVFEVIPLAGPGRKPGSRSRRGGVGQSGRAETTSGVARGAACVELVFGRGDVDCAAVALGSSVWKTDDPQLRREIERDMQESGVVHAIPLTVQAAVSITGELTICLSEPSGLEARVTAEHPIAPAERHPLTRDLLAEHFARLGGTPFILEKIELIGPHGPAESVPVLAPKSMLNRLRRAAVAQLEEQRAARSRHPVANRDALSGLVAELHAELRVLNDRTRCRTSPFSTATVGERMVDPSRSPMAHLDWSPEAKQPKPACDVAAVGGVRAAEPPRLAVLVRNLAQLQAVREWVAANPAGLLGPLYCDLSDPADWSRAMEARTEGLAVGLVTPRALHAGDAHILDRLIAARPDVVLVRTLGALRYLRRAAPDLVLVGDSPLNAANHVTAGLLLRAGLARVAPAQELDAAELAALLAGLAAMNAAVAPQQVEIVLRERVALFHTRHCLFAAATASATCADCAHPCRQHTLQLDDHAGARHPVLVDALARNTVYGAAAHSRDADLPAMRCAGLTDFRFELVDESPAEVQRLLTHYAALLSRPLG